MKIFIIISTILLIVSSNVCVPSDKAYNIWDCYTVQEGDSIYSIADQLNTSPILLCDYNANFLQGNCTNLPVGTQLKVPKTCVPMKDHWYCQKLTNDYLNPIVNETNIHWQWFYTYNSEYLNQNYSKVGMNVRVPYSNYTRICIPGVTQYCKYIEQDISIYDLATETFQNAQTLLNYNEPWVFPPLIANAGWLINIPRHCNNTPGVHICYKVQINDTFDIIGQKFNVDPNQLCEYNKNNYHVYNCSFMLYEDNELMIPVLTASRQLPTKPGKQQLLEKTQRILQEVTEQDDDQCKEEKETIKKLQELELQLIIAIKDMIDPLNKITI